MARTNTRSTEGGERRSKMTERLDGRILEKFNPDDLDAYMDEIDDMSLDELEEQLPQAQEALVCAAAMSARLSALKQAGDPAR
jgi:hypothetical protein